MTRSWTRYYPPGTSTDIPPLTWPHLPAFIAEAIATYAARPAFTLFLPNGTQGTLTYRDIDRHSDALAAYFREVAGFAAGDRVALQLPNCLAYPVAVIACLKAGLVMVNTNPLYTTAEMTHQFADSGAVGLVALDVFADQGRRRPAADADPPGRPGQRGRPAADAQALRRPRGPALRQENDPAGHLCARHVPGSAVAGRGAARRRHGRLAIRPGSRTTPWRRCSTPAGRQASPRAPC